MLGLMLLHNLPCVTYSNLKCCRLVLKQWNKVTFGNVFDMKRVNKLQVSAIEEELETNWSSNANDILQNLRKEWQEVSTQATIYWKQKFHNHWL